jgi:hypothetical protein
MNWAKQAYDELVALARACLAQSRASSSPDVAAELRKMAAEYQLRAAQLTGGNLPDIDDASTGRRLSD